MADGTITSFPINTTTLQQEDFLVEAEAALLRAAIAEKSASTSASQAEKSAITATEEAKTASSHASIAESKANEAERSATTASQKAEEIATSANTATSKAKEASDSAADAYRSAEIARELSPKTISVLLPLTGWDGMAQTVDASGVTADNIIFVVADPLTTQDYYDSGVRAISQALNKLTFTCDELPSGDVKANVAIFNLMP